MFTLLIRTFILFFIIIFTMRIMGKRQIGELQPYEFVLTIIISDLASLPISDLKTPLAYSVFPILTLTFLQSILSYMQLKHENMRYFFCGKPSIIINKGKIVETEMREQKLNIDDLLEELRLGGYYDLSEIEFAILETSGEVSIIPKSYAKQVTLRDMNIKCKRENLQVTIIADGLLRLDNLNAAGKNINWLNSELKKQNIDSISNVFIGIVKCDGDAYFQIREDKK